MLDTIRNPPDKAGPTLITSRRVGDVDTADPNMAIKYHGDSSSRLPSPLHGDACADSSQRIATIPRTPLSSATAWEKLRASAWKWDRRFERRGGQLLKRCMDVITAALFLLLFSPLLVIIAACIKLHDGGAVFFWQTRVGRHGQTFAFPKFRSMRIDAEHLKAALLKQNDHGESITFKMRDDPRITPIGKFLRRFSLDELPQLWCVLQGDMSVVGPRPAVPSEVAQYTPYHRQRLRAHPGLTCVWQVSGRGELSFEQQVLLDLEYIQNQSFWTDIWLIARTVPAVLIGRGAY